MASSVVSVDEVERMLGGGKLGSDDRTFISTLEKAAVRWFEEMTNRTLDDSGEVTEYRNGNGLRELQLFNDTSSITSVAEWNGVVWDTVTSTKYQVYDDNKLARIDGNVWETGIKNLRIIYTAGYDDGDVPEDIAMAIAWWIVNEWRRARGSDSAVNESPPWVKALVDPWVVDDFVPSVPLMRA